MNALPPAGREFRRVGLRVPKVASAPRQPHSRVWFTLSHGILNEVYYPRVDHACTRDLGLIVTDGSSSFSEEKRNCKFENHAIAPGVPVYRLTNTELQGRYRIEKEVFSDP